MTEKRAPRRKIIRPKDTEVQVNPNMSIVPSLDTLLNDALTVIGNELNFYKHKTKKGVTLDLKEARAVQGYMDQLTKMAREAREQAKSEDLTNLTTEQLIELASQLQKPASDASGDQIRTSQAKLVEKASQTHLNASDEVGAPKE